MNRALRLGTRSSLLALRQSESVAADLRAAHPGLAVELVHIKTTGDRITDRPLADAGGKGLFVKELEVALLEGQIDFAVHSCKDVPVTMPLVDDSDLLLAALPKRADVRDVLISSTVQKIADLPPSARVGTSSLRRRSQLLALRQDLCIEPIRGNIDTRLKRQQAGDSDAIMLAMAGLQRSGLHDLQRMHAIPVETILPAAGQGALALQCRRSDAATRVLLAALDHAETRLSIETERRIVRTLGGDCHSPIAALVEIDQGHIRIRVIVGARDGGAFLVRAEATTPLAQLESGFAKVIQSLTEQNVKSLLHG